METKLNQLRTILAGLAPEDLLLSAGEDSPVPQLREHGIRHGGDDQLFDQPGGLLPPAAVIQGYDFVHNNLFPFKLPCARGAVAARHTQAP